MRPGQTFAIHTLGCKLNYAESSGISRDLEDLGFAKIGVDENPDILILNTCSVTENADKKCRQFVRKHKNQNPEIFIAVIGCYAQLKPEEIKDIKGVNLVLGASEKFNLGKHIIDQEIFNEPKTVGGPIKDVKEFAPSFSHGDRTRSFLKVQDGCDYFCTFCTIPLARGLSRSANVKETLQQAEKIAQLGIKEIVLTGVNIGDFGANTNESFLDLIKALDEISGIERFRISSIEPNLLSNEIIDFVASSKRFMPHFHLPLQSGCDDLLKMMKRKYDTLLYTNRVERIKQVMPHACIGVDVITGFPGETETDYLKTSDYLIDLDVSYLHVFTYSERSNTKATRMQDVVPINVRRDRSKKLQELSRKKKRHFYNQFINQEMPVLFEKNIDGFIYGFTENYLRARLIQERSLENEIVNIRLRSISMDGDMISELVKTKTLQQV